MGVNSEDKGKFNMSTEEIKKALHLGECSLSYKKLDEETRVAFGTLNLDLIPKEFHPKNKKSENTHPQDGDLIHYYDFVSQGWRCFWSNRLTNLTFINLNL
jgi:hypothetical protein